MRQRRWKTRLVRRTGQSILEYLVIATVVIAAILAISIPVGQNANKVMNQSASKIDQGATVISNLNVNRH